MTARKRAEAVLGVLHETERKILRHEPIERILQFICDEVAGRFGFAVVWIGIKEPDGSISQRAVAGPARGLRPAEPLSLGRRARGQGPSGEAIRSGRPVVIETTADERFAAWTEGVRKFHLGSGLSHSARRRGDRARSSLELLGAAERLRRRDDRAPRALRRPGGARARRVRAARPDRAADRRARSGGQRGPHHGPRGPDRVGQPRVHVAHRMAAGGGHRGDAAHPEVGPRAPLFLQEALGNDPRGTGLAGRAPEPAQGRHDLHRGADHHAGPSRRTGRSATSSRSSRTSRPAGRTRNGSGISRCTTRSRTSPTATRSRSRSRARCPARAADRAVVASPARPRQLQDRQRRARPSRRRPGARRARPPHRDARPPRRRGRPVRRRRVRRAARGRRPRGRRGSRRSACGNPSTSTGSSSATAPSTSASASGWSRWTGRRTRRP